MKKVLITGSGSGFGKLYSLELARRGYDVYAGVEIPSQITELREEAKKRGLHLYVFKLDITNKIDINHAKNLDIDILVNNAGIGEGGAISDMPSEVLRRQFEINFFSTIELTQIFLKKFSKKKNGRVVFVSSVAGLITAEYSGAYCASKHALEAAAEAFKIEMKDYGVSIATINPGPYQTGFNDRLMEASQNWYNKDDSMISHDNLSFPMEQLDPNRDIANMVDVIINEKSKFRNMFPIELIDMVKNYQKNLWEV